MQFLDGENIKMKQLVFMLLILTGFGVNAATKRVNLPLAEYAVLLANNGQALQLYLNESINFKKTVRPYTEGENKDFLCNLRYLLNENLKFTDQYPEYANVPNVKNYINGHQQQIVNIDNQLKGKGSCQKFLVYTPKADSPGAQPLAITENEGSQILFNYYQERERLLNEINLATDEPTKIKKLCELIKFGTITKMSKIAFYPNLNRSSEGRKALATISQDEYDLRGRLPVLHKCS